MVLLFEVFTHSFNKLINKTSHVRHCSKCFAYTNVFNLLNRPSKQAPLSSPFYTRTLINMEVKHAQKSQIQQITTQVIWIQVCFDLIILPQIWEFENPLVCFYKNRYNINGFNDKTRKLNLLKCILFLLRTHLSTYKISPKSPPKSLLLMPNRE